MDLTVSVMGILLRSLNSIYLKIRQRLPEACEQATPLIGAVEVDEPYFSARFVRARRGRGTYGNTIVFGLLKRQGMVYTESYLIAPRPRCKGLSRHMDPASVVRWLDRLRQSG